jgi:methionine synthase I (cobalamin-dependent)
VSLSHPILSRLDTGRPLLVSGDPLASLRAGGVDLHGPTSVGRLLREHPTTVREHYFQDIAAGVDVLCCVTAETMPRALQQIGMPFRAALLTGQAVELALEAAELTPRPLIVAGVLGNKEVSPAPGDRLDEDLETHARRLATAGCELILAHGSETDASHAAAARRAAIASGVKSLLPTWAASSLDMGGFTVDGMAADACARLAFAGGAQLALFEVPSIEVALAWTDRLLAVAAAGGAAPGGCYVGFSPAAGSLGPDAWAHDILGLLDAGARVIGGGAGTTQRHLAALSSLLRRNERPPSIWPRSA